MSFSEKKIADRGYKVHLKSNDSSLLPCLDAQIVKEVGGVRGAQQEAAESIKSLVSGVFIINVVKEVE